jgi:hypothetical protein
MPRRLLVCGGREYVNRERVFYVLDAYHKKFGISVLIHGAARGADSLADEWAVARGVETDPFPANWKKYGRRAGFIRNTHMLEEGNPDDVIAFPGGVGTAMMCKIAEMAGKPVYQA